MNNSFDYYNRKINRTFNSVTKKHHTLMMIGFTAGLVVVVYLLYKHLHLSFDLKAMYNWIVGNEQKIVHREGEVEIDEKQVFNISQNIFTYSDAKLVCRSFGAELATIEQMMEAYKRGANWCNMGWTGDQMGTYPIQKEFWESLSEEDINSEKCGTPGINAGYYKNTEFKFGANCYGIKPTPHNNERINLNYVNQYSESEKQIMKFKRNRDNYTIQPFNKDYWSEYQ